MRRIVDLSVSLQAGIASDPPGHLPEIDYLEHADTREDMLQFFPGARAADLPDGEGWAIERVRLTTHNGTHLDAPYHYASTMDGDSRAITIDEVPLDWCFGRGVKLDFRHFDDGYIVTTDDIDRELDRIGFTLRPFDIVLVNTSAGSRYGHDDYVVTGCGMGREATLHLLRQGVRVTGTDAWSWDAPFVHTARRYAADHDPGIIWEGHRAGREIGYCHIEKLGNLGMRIGSLLVDGVQRYGVVNGNTLDLIEQTADVFEVLATGDPAGVPAGQRRPWDATASLAAPVPVTSIRDFITFEQHTAGSLRAITGNSDVPDAWHEAPAFYFTNPHAAIGSGTPVPMPPGCTVLDFELEVAVVIRKAGFNLSVDEAFDHVAGFTILNDWSARDLQQREMRVGLGPAKGKDTATTLGPVLVTPDELAGYERDGRYDLTMEVFVNDTRIGGDTMANMAWTFAELIAYASRGTWVRPGDVLGSGTCGKGCLAELWGWRRDQHPPPLRIGDNVRMTVEGIGTIHNTVTAGPPLHPVPAAARTTRKSPQ